MPVSLQTLEEKTPALARLRSLCTGCVRVHSADGGDGPGYRSAIAKSPLPGPAFIGRLGLAGDEQADRKNHGGPDKAVHAHFAQHLAWWGERRGTPLPDGAIGENLTLIAGDAGEPDEECFCIGDVLAVGTALLQVSQPRIPCFKQARRLGLRDGVALALASGRTGFYLRVLREGQAVAGDSLRLLSRPHPWASIAEVNRALHPQRRDPAVAARLAELAELAASVRRELTRQPSATAGG